MPPKAHGRIYIFIIYTLFLYQESTTVAEHKEITHLGKVCLQMQQINGVVIGNAEKAAEEHTHTS